LSGPRAAVIGLGGMGRRHLAALAAIGAEIRAVCDLSDAARAAALGAQARGAGAYARWEELIEREAGRLDLITVATNGPTHHPIVLAAAQAGIRNVLCEKPMATSARKAREMAEACRARGVRLAVNLSRRFAGRFLRVRELIAAGTIGEVHHVSVSVGAGGLGCIGTHYFDLVAWLTKGQARWLVGEIEREPAPNVRGAQFFDPGGRGMVWYRSGMTACYQFSERVAITPLMQVIGSDGYVDMDSWSPPQGGQVEVYARTGAGRAAPRTRFVAPERVPFDAGAGLDVVDATRACIEDLLGRHAVETVQPGIDAVDVVMAFHLSARAGLARVSLPLEGEALDLDVPIT
jgi:predicted dehydrogenase